MTTTTGIFTGRIAGIRDGVGFHADSVDSLRQAFHEAVEDYLETCAKIGKEPQRAYSGRVMFRVSPETHRKAALAAELSGKSLNQWAEEVLDRAAATDSFPAVASFHGRGGRSPAGLAPDLTGERPRAAPHAPSYQRTVECTASVCSGSAFAGSRRAATSSTRRSVADRSPAWNA